MRRGFLIGAVGVMTIALMGVFAFAIWVLVSQAFTPIRVGSEPPPDIISPLFVAAVFVGAGLWAAIAHAYEAAWPDRRATDFGETLWAAVFGAFLTALWLGILGVGAWLVLRAVGVIGS